MTNGQSPVLGEAVGTYLAGLSPETKGANQSDVYNFMRWFGKSRPMGDITASEVGNFAERLSLSDTDYMHKLEIVKGFLVYAKKQGWTRTNLANHLKAKKTKDSKRRSSSRNAQEKITMTQEGYDKLVAELETLKEARVEVTKDIAKAAADKDFRENAPLHAAREKKGHIEGRIMELEATINAADVVDANGSNSKVSIGCCVILNDLASNKETRYMLVSSSEVDPACGKISGASPIGKALMDREQGDTVEITAPAGKLKYKILKIER